MTDPIFKLSLPASQYTHGFDEAPLPLLQQCGVTVAATSAYRDWILATADEPSGQYFMLAGVIGSRSQTGSIRWQADGNGAFLRVNDKTCTPIDPADGVFTAVSSYGDDPSMPIPAKVFDDLAGNAVSRYIRLFHTKALFVSALQRQYRYPTAPDMSVLRRAIIAAPPG